MYNDKSPLPGGRLMVDSPTIFFPLFMFVVVTLSCLVISVCCS